MKLKLRIAFREEGTFWNAYVANTSSMEGAYIIGSIAMGAVTQNPDIKARFMDLMKDVLADAIKSTTGNQVGDWETNHAPAHERGGRA